MAYRHVTIHYGACRSLFDDTIYRPRKFNGIKAHLQKLGYRVNFAKAPSWRDYCILELCGHEVFRCNVKYLHFNTCVERDPVAQRAIDAVLNATDSCLRARDHIWIRRVLLESLFDRRDYTSQDYWAFSVDMDDFTFECKTCCGRFFVPEEEEEESRPPTPPKHYTSNTNIN